MAPDLLAKALPVKALEHKPGIACGSSMRSPVFVFFLLAPNGPRKIAQILAFIGTFSRSDRSMDANSIVPPPGLAL